MTRIVHPHNALGVGELEDHVGHQVTLRQQARTGCVVNVSANLFSNPASQRLDAVSFVAQRTQLFAGTARFAGAAGYLPDVFYGRY
ncbi:Uncharacterised protein [Escherichia coli]|uniref:Uncharacterized protein n=1 Tax=Escherichia coli TaxID=562 RepID=A0A376KIX3_ECOLX|nr:Uncharacterised protein [Escherichia coli]